MGFEGGGGEGGEAVEDEEDGEGHFWGLGRGWNGEWCFGEERRGGIGSL